MWDTTVIEQFIANAVAFSRTRCTYPPIEVFGGHWFVHYRRLSMVGLSRIETPPYASRERECEQSNTKAGSERAVLI